MKKRIIKSNARNEEKERREQVLGTKTRRRRKEGRRGMKETVWSDTDRQMGDLGLRLVCGEHRGTVRRRGRD